MSVRKLASRRGQIIRCAAAAVAYGAIGGAADAATVNFGGRTWATGNGQGYTAGASTGTMTGQWAQDAVLTTPVTLNVGDVISFDSSLSSGGWFSDTGFGFIDNTGLYDSTHSAYHGGKVERRNTSTWEFYALDPSNTQKAYWYIPNNSGDNIHYEWLFDNALHAQVTMTVAGNAPVTTGFDISDIADIKAFKAWLWDSQHTLSVSNFKQRPSLLPASGLQRAWSATSGDYTNGGNWTGGSAPTLADDAIINNGGVATVSTAAASSGRAVNLDVSNGTLNVQSGGELFAANIIRIGSGTSTATVNQTGGLVSVDINSGADLRIGFDAGATGNYNLSGGELWVADSLAVGQNGTGSMTMTGGWISHAGFFTVGNNPGANGTFVMHGGTVDQTFGDFEVGDEAVGNVTIDGGTFNTAPRFWFSIGNRPLGTGTATIAGTATVNTNEIVVGRNATNTSTLNINGGTTNIPTASDGGGGKIFVGLNGPGVFNMTAGVVKMDDDFIVAYQSSGNATISGGDVQIGDDFVIGQQNTGVFTLSGGTISKAGYIVLGDEQDVPIDEITRGTGTLNVTGGTINQTFGDLEIGDAGTGTFNQSGGAVHVAEKIYVGKQASGIGAAHVSGGALTAQAMVNNGTFDASGNGTTSLGANGGSGFIDGAGSITVANTAVINAAHVRQSSLTMTGGRVNVAPTGTGTADGVSVVNNIALSGTAKLDLGDNKLITNTVPGSASGGGGVYGGVQGDVQRAYNFGAWDQGGLTTSKSDALAGLTTIGVATGAQIRGLGPTDTDIFAGQVITGASTIAMYTYAGDANLDGTIDGGDYGIIDNFVQVPGADGYANGDFNYDGVIDGGDYGIIDNNIQAQGAPFSTSGAAAAALSGVTAVPEPAVFSFAFVAASYGLFTRRPRRRRRDHREWTATRG